MMRQETVITTGKKSNRYPDGCSFLRFIIFLLVLLDAIQYNKHIYQQEESL